MNGRGPCGVYNAIWLCVLKYARCEHQARQLGSRRDFEILLIASLADNMMHVTSDSTKKRGQSARTNETVLRVGGAGRWMLFSTTLTLQMVAREQRCLTPHTLAVNSGNFLMFDINTKPKILNH